MAIYSVIIYSIVSQHGFCKNRSTTTNLLESLNDLTLTLLSKDQHVVVYIDFSKARLESYGIRGTVLLWLINFFTGRTHQTKIDFTLSEVALLYSGVVQGSGIGPLMFLVYINELIYVLEEHGIIVKLFADDVKMYAKIMHDVDIVRLQCHVL